VYPSTNDIYAVRFESLVDVVPYEASTDFSGLRGKVILDLRELSHRDVYALC
jgi:hypothetical protein